MTRAFRNTVAALGTVAMIGLSYVMALAGEPASVWLWRDVLGAMQR